MSIILNERAWAEEAITYKSLGKKPSETLLRVARYYFDEQYSRQEVRHGEGIICNGDEGGA